MIHPDEVPKRIIQELRNVAAWLKHSAPDQLEEILNQVTGAMIDLDTGDPDASLFVACRELARTRLDQARVEKKIYWPRGQA